MNENLVAFRVPAELLASIDALARSLGITRSAAIRQACVAWASGLKVPPKKRRKA